MTKANAVTLALMIAAGVATTYAVRWIDRKVGA